MSESNPRVHENDDDEFSSSNRFSRPSKAEYKADPFSCAMIDIRSAVKRALQNANNMNEDEYQILQSVGLLIDPFMPKFTYEKANESWAQLIHDPF